MDTVSEFHAEEPQTTASDGLAQCLYVAARVGFKSDERRLIYQRATTPQNSVLCARHKILCLRVPLQKKS